MFCRFSAPQSSVFKSGKLLLMSIPSWVQRPRDQPPSSEPWEKIQNMRNPQASGSFCLSHTWGTSVSISISISIWGVSLSLYTPSDPKMTSKGEYLVNNLLIFGGWWIIEPSNSWEGMHRIIPAVWQRSEKYEVSPASSSFTSSTQVEWNSK